MSMLEELRALTASVAERAGGSVVGIGQGWGTGSGFVFQEGLVATNAHHVRGDGAPSVILADGSPVEAEVRGADLDGDLAVLAVDTRGAGPIAMADASPSVGDFVLGLTNPGGRGLRVTSGQVAAVGRSFPGPGGRAVTGTIEHTAPLPRGSSGAPLLDTSGRVVGINTNRLGEGLYAAIAADGLGARLAALAGGQVPQRRRLGIAIVPPVAARRLRQAVGLADREGLLVRSVAEAGPAARSGIRAGDMLTVAGDTTLRGAEDLWGVLDRLGGSPTLDVSVVRGTEELVMTISFV
ncbi:MAG: S1C family serine protease [Acidimicrobiales bacterium]